VTNLRVGVQVLFDCVRKAGSVEGGLKLYVGAVATDGSDYVTKVMAEHLRLRDVAAGKKVPVNVPTVTNAATELLQPFAWAALVTCTGTTRLEGLPCTTATF
jgi:hypothetical protein